MQSKNSRLLTLFLSTIHFKKIVAWTFSHPSRKSKLIVPKFLYKKLLVSDFKVDSKMVITIQPKKEVEKNHIIYFHGGAYVLEGSTLHWKMIAYLSEKANSRVSYIQYPLVPEYNYINTFVMVQQSFIKLTILYPNDTFIFMGDSAGGGLALAFAQKLAKEHAALQPIKNILFSPWLDITLENPQIKALLKLDKILPLKELIIAGKKYLGTSNKENYLVSPIYGDVDGIGKTLIFYGTHELFYADCKKLEEKSKNNSNIIFIEFSEMQHDWVILPIPESTKALEMVVNFIKS